VCVFGGGGGALMHACVHACMLHFSFLTSSKARHRMMIVMSLLPEVCWIVTVEGWIIPVGTHTYRP
jgi:hypothetical protein